MSLTPKIGCVQHDCDQCVRIFAELSRLRAQVSTLQARADAGDRLRDRFHELMRKYLEEPILEKMDDAIATYDATKSEVTK